MNTKLYPEFPTPGSFVEVAILLDLTCHIRQSPQIPTLTNRFNGVSNFLSGINLLSDLNEMNSFAVNRSNEAVLTTIVNATCRSEVQPLGCGDDLLNPPFEIRL